MNDHALITAGSQSGDDPVAIFVMGPTASGKTDLAVECVRHLPCDIISVDSAMVFRGMDIGTAKPDASTLETAPHRLIDILDPSEVYSAARFREDALREMKCISDQGRIPLLVGGTMLYFHALQSGLSSLPSADPGVRARLLAEADRFGWEYMHRRLAEVDPDAAARIHPHDPQRIQRALEVYEITGQPMSVLRAKPRSELLPYRLIKIALMPENRARLRERIASRFLHMLESGLVEEVSALYERGDLTPEMPSIRSVGYRQVWDYLEGGTDQDQMRYRGITATCQLAKRQITWLKRELNCNFFDTQPVLFANMHRRLKITLSL